MKEKIKNDKKNPTVFSRRLDAAMKQKRVTNHKLALRLYCSDSAISGYRTGQRDPQGATIRELCLALHISSDYLLGLSDSPGYV